MVSWKPENKKLSYLDIKNLSESDNHSSSDLEEDLEPIKEDEADDYDNKI